jgi:hypothetical protein
LHITVQILTSSAREEAYDLSPFEYARAACEGEMRKQYEITKNKELL